jgi:hypothetical protein
MRILVSEKNGCVYTWDYVENTLMYTPFLNNDTFNTLDFMEVTDIEIEQFYRLKDILKGGNNGSMV